MEKMNLETSEICPAFRDFRFTGWDSTDAVCVIDADGCVHKTLGAFVYID